MHIIHLCQSPNFHWCVHKGIVRAIANFCGKASWVWKFSQDIILQQKSPSFDFVKMYLCFLNFCTFCQVVKSNFGVFKWCKIFYRSKFQWCDTCTDLTSGPKNSAMGAKSKNIHLLKCFSTQDCMQLCGNVQEKVAALKKERKSHGCNDVRGVDIWELRASV